MHSPHSISFCRPSACYVLSLPRPSSCCRRIARNRERLLALGIPSLVTELGGSKAAAAAKKQQKKKPREREGGEDWGPRPKRRRGGQSEQPARRSRRLQQTEEHQREEEENGRQGRSFAAGDTMSWRSRACALPGRRAPLAAGRPTSGHGLVSWWPSCCWTSPVCPRPGPQRRSVLSVSWASLQWRGSARAAAGCWRRANGSTCRCAALRQGWEA